MTRILLTLVLTFLLIQGNFGRIEIHVRDAGTRAAVPGVPMTLTASTGNDVRHPTTTVLTDPRGIAVFGSLPPGAYFIKVDGSFRPVNYNEYVLIEPGSQRQVEISVNPSATVTGRVVDPAGQPLPDSTVSLLSTVYVGGRPVVRSSGVRGKSGTDGKFRLTDVPFADYYLQIDNAEALATPSPSDFARYVYYPAETAISGASRLAVRAIEVSIGDIRVPDTRVFKVSGTMVNPFGEATATFYLAPADISPAVDATMLQARFKQAANRNELTFEIGGLVPGRYVLHNVSSLALPPDSSTIRTTINGVTPGFSLSRTTVSIEDRDLENIRLVSSPRREVRGRVMSSSLSMELFANVSVELLPREPVPGLIAFNNRVRIDNTGRFVFANGADTVRWGINVLGLPPDAYVNDVRIANVSTFPDGSLIARSSDDALEIEVSSPGGVFRGIVRDTKNQTVSRAVVVVVPDWPYRPNNLFYRRTPTDANGEFTLRGIAPGEYQLFAFTAALPAGAEQDADFMAPYTGRGTTLRATAGVTTEASLRVIEFP